MDPIDLTLDDDVEVYRQPKRARTNNGNDSDVNMVDDSLPTAGSAYPEPMLGENEDLMITKQTGQVRAGRHLPFIVYQACLAHAIPACTCLACVFDRIQVIPLLH